MSKKTTASYQDLIAGLALEIITGDIEETYKSPDMERGADMEPEAADFYSSQFDVDLQEVGFCTLGDDSPFDDWTGSSPDRLTDDGGLLEIKCPKANTHFKYLKAGRMPAEYRWQVQHQLWVTGADYCDFMSYYPKLKPFVIRVYPDSEMRQQIGVALQEGIADVMETIKIYKEYE